MTRTAVLIVGLILILGALGLTGYFTYNSLDELRLQQRWEDWKKDSPEKIAEYKEAFAPEQPFTQIWLESSQTYAGLAAAWGFVSAALILGLAIYWKRQPAAP